MNDYVVFGKGKRSLVVIPGLSLRSVSETPELLEQIFSRFTDDWRVFVIDRPAVIPDGTTNKDLADAYADIMERLGTGCSDIIGASQGGMIAQYLAIEHPELVHKLVLESSLSIMNDTATSVLGHWAELAEKGCWKEMNLDFFAKLYSEKYCQTNRKAIDKFAGMLKPDDAHRFVNLTRACMTGGPYDRLEQIKCPTFVLGGVNDQVLTAAGSQYIADRTGCRINLIEGYGHAVYDEMPGFYNMVFDFLKI